MNEKLGYYVVNNQKFQNKLMAILEANRLDVEIKWHFNNEVFDKVDWTVEPDILLLELYRIRAKQIRDRFDYVILMVSGGADSTNMLNSFLDNQIRVDEIIASAPLEGLKNWKIDFNDTSADNTISETWLAQMPLLKKISNLYPDIKITINDYFNDILSLKTDEWIYESSTHWIHFSGATRHSLDKFSHLKNMAENGKTIGVLYGIDKPIICRSESGNLYSVILDPVVNVVTPHFKERYPNVESVLFYYSPELPELLVKQAHQVCKWIHLPQNLHIRKNMLWDLSKTHEFNASPKRASDWQRNIISCIYPTIHDFTSKVWQAEKQSTGFKGGMQIDKWMFKLHNNSKIIQLVESDINLFTKNIKQKYMLTENKIDGFKRFSNYWKIGNEKKFMNEPLE